VVVAAAAAAVIAVVVVVTVVVVFVFVFLLFTRCVNTLMFAGRISCENNCTQEECDFEFEVLLVLVLL